MGAATADNAVIQGLWVGSRLSVMEQLSIASFLHNGHTYHLYVYEHVENIPAGTVVKDANAVLPESAIFQYPDRASYAGFANWFRYELLSEAGGWWADTDMVCLRPFDFTSAYVFASEPADPEDRSTVSEVVTNSAIKAPAGSEAMAHASRACAAKDISRLTWGETGPRLLQQTVQRLGLRDHVVPHTTFCPFGWPEWEMALDPDIGWDLDETTYAVHLYNEMWRLSARDKDERYSPGCLYEELKRRYMDP